MIFVLILFVLSIVIFYIGYNGFTRTKEFFCNYDRLLCIDPKSHRKHWVKTNRVKEYKITSIFLMSFSVIIFIFFIVSLFREPITFFEFKIPTIISRNTVLDGAGYFIFFSVIISIPIMLHRIEILRKLNKSLFFRCRIKNFSFQMIYKLKPGKKIDTIKKQYRKYQILTVIFWLYHIWVITGLIFFSIYYFKV